MLDIPLDSQSDCAEGPPSGSPDLLALSTSCPELEARFISGKRLTEATLRQYEQFKLVGCSENTIRLCKSAVERFLRYLSSRMDANLLLVYMEYMRMINSTMAPNTYARERGRVNSFLSWAVAMGHLEVCPSSLCRTPTARIVSQHERIITPDDYLAIKQTCDSMGNTALKELIMTGYWTGMALGDSCVITWSNVNLDSMIISSPRLKTAIKTEIPIVAGSDFHRYLVGRLPMSKDKEWPNDPERGVFFVNTFLAAAYHSRRKGGKDRLTNWVRRAFSRAGLPNHTFHDLRRTMATVLCSSSVSVGVIMRVMGWTSPTMITKYLMPGHGGLLEAFTEAMKDRDETSKHILHSRRVPPAVIRSFEHPQIENDPDS